MPAAGICTVAAGVVSGMTVLSSAGAGVHDAMVERGQVTRHHRDPVTARASTYGREDAALAGFGEQPAEQGHEDGGDGGGAVDAQDQRPRPGTRTGPGSLRGR